MSFSAYANIGDYFGSSAATVGISGQANFNDEDASNNQYAGSLIAGQKKTAYSFNFFAIDMNFKKINNVVVSSPMNSAESTEKYGNVDTDYDNQYILGIHGSFNLFKRLSTKLNLSVYVPTEKMLEASTGDPYRPEYVMYRSRFLRTIFLVNLAHQFDELAVSIGGLSGFQSNGETYVVARETGSSNPPSNGKMSFNARPSMALTFSISKKFENSKVYFSYQDEMKNELSNHASGYTPIGASSLKYDWDLSTMLYYDPRIYRLGATTKINSIELFGTLEYQDWSGYASPVLEMNNNGGFLLGTNNKENFTTRNIIVPKLGMSYKNEKHTYLAGLSYRQSPLDLKEGASGNSIDTDATIFSFGYLREFSAIGQNFTFNSGAQYHELKTTKITKSPNRENGDAGEKIGASEYEAGGNVIALSFGLSWIL